MSASASASEAQQQTIRLDELPLQRVHELQQRVDQELNFFVESLGSLEEVERKFRTSKQNVLGMHKETDGNEALVPLTESMYVKGKLRNCGHVLVELGTGYYAQLPLDRAEAFFDRKQKFVQKQISQIKDIIMEKQKMKQAVAATLQAKVAETLATRA